MENEGSSRCKRNKRRNMAKRDLMLQDWLPEAECKSGKKDEH